jgi:hypothetical protein
MSEGPADHGRELTPEQIAEQIKQLKISDLLVTNMSVIAQLGYAKLEPGSRDLEQARVAIEALRALVRVLEGTAEPDVLRSFGQAVANLQLAYASAVGQQQEKPAEAEKSGADDAG